METKGTSVLAAINYVKKYHGEDGYERFLEALEPESREILTHRILPSAWYPLRPAFIEPIRVTCDQFYHGSEEGARQLGRHAADEGLTGLYKVFVRFGSVEFLVKRASKIFPTYYRPSAMETVDLKKGAGTVRITQFDDPDHFLEISILGWMERAIEISGCYTGKVAMTCSLAKGASCTEFDITW